MAEEYPHFLEPMRNAFQRVAQVFHRHHTLTNIFWEEVKAALLATNFGPTASLIIVQRLQQRALDEHIYSSAELYMVLRQELLALPGTSSTLRSPAQSPLVIVIMGEKDSGKTTSAVKLAYRLANERQKILLVTTNTARSDNTNYLDAQIQKINARLTRQQDTANSRGVVHDALQTAIADTYNTVIVDTTAPLATEERHLANLRDINKIIQQIMPDAPYELLVVLDAEQGLNGLLQTRQLGSETGLTGVILTRIDRSEKCGFAFAVADDLAVPIKFLGTGEGIGNLFPFDPKGFIAALFQDR